MLAAFLPAIPVGMGLGGGGLTGILLFLLGKGERLAVGSNLFCFLFSGGASLVGARRLLWEKRRSLLLPLLFSALAATGGGLLAVLSPPALLRRVFGGFSALLGLLTLTRGIKLPKNRAAALDKAVRP